MYEELKAWTKWLAVCALFVIAVAWVVGLTPFGRDNSDAGQWGDTRSGVSVVTDALTGCQYLATPGGGITPRVNKAGQQIGCSK